MQKLDEFIKNNQLKVLSEHDVKRFYFSQFIKIDCDVYLPFYKKKLQRDLVWSGEQKEDLIKSLIIGLAIPPIIIAQRLPVKNDFTQEVFIKSGNKFCYIIDGKQRLNTVQEYLNNKFSVFGCFYDDLPKVSRLSNFLNGQDLQEKIRTGLDCVYYPIPVLSSNLYNKELETFLFPKDLQDDMITLFLKHNNTGVSQDKRSLKKWAKCLQVSTRPNF